MGNKDLLIFLIGGSGARFLRSLIFQLASGLKLNDIGTIKIIIIDSDKGNGNLEQPLTLIENYREIRRKLYSDNEYRGKLFYHELEYFDENEKVLSPLSDNVQTIEKIINYSNLDTQQRGLIELLLTGEELSSNLQVGFEGRPNMGTIGLQRLDKQIQKSRKLTQIIGDNPNPSGLITAASRIFIVSSMFGGMGSSGMPLLVRKFSSTSFDNYPIGCLCFMPYFKINDGEGTTDSKHFIPRTQIALEYYKRELKDKVDRLYYIGDDIGLSKGEKHAKGGKLQENNAHYVEYFAISGLIHFCQNASSFKRDAKEMYLCFDDERQANATAYEINSKDFQVFLMIARYYIDHFVKSYDKNELENISWAVHADLKGFTTEDKLLLKTFFEKVLQYNDGELNEHSGMNVIKTEFIPSNIISAIPYPEYKPHRRWLSEVKYDNWPAFNSNVLSDSGIKSTVHISRLIAIFENSFNTFYKNRFKS